VKLALRTGEVGNGVAIGLTDSYQEMPAESTARIW